jgi:hypothetical protein
MLAVWVVAMGVAPLDVSGDDATGFDSRSGPGHNALPESASRFAGIIEYWKWFGKMVRGDLVMRRVRYEIGSYQELDVTALIRTTQEDWP